MNHKLPDVKSFDTVRDLGHSEQLDHELDLRHVSTIATETFETPYGTVEPWSAALQTHHRPSHGTRLPSMRDLELPVFDHNIHQSLRPFEHEQPFGPHTEVSVNSGVLWNSFGQSNLYQPEQSVETSRSIIAELDESSTPLKCSYPPCNAIFQGTYRHGNKGRHERSKHRATEARVYHCEVQDCVRMFHRQDARLKHYRKCHPELNLARPLSRRLPNRRRISGEEQDEWSAGGETGEWHMSMTEDDPMKHEYLLPRRASISDTGIPSQTLPTDVFEPEHMLSLQREDNRLFPEVHTAGLAETLKSEDERNSTNDSQRACSRCESTFRRAADLRRHMRKHAESKIICSVSGCTHTRGFYRMDKLRDHVHRVHNGTVVANDNGGLVFSVPEALHNSQLMFKCEQCGEGYTRQADLNTHIARKHSKQHKCDLCEDRSFALRADLERHRKAMHTVASYHEVLQCPNEGCTVTFNRRDNLLRHAKRCKLS